MALSRQFVDLGTFVSALVFGVLVTVLVTVSTENYWLGHCEGTNSLVRVNALGTKVVEVVAEYPYPAPASVDSGWVSKKVTLAGNHYLMARQYEDRFRAITGIG